MLFSERNKLAEEYRKWLLNNPEIKDCPFNIISFLDGKNILSKQSGKEEVNENIEIKWSWNETYSDNWKHGVFDTKEEAIKDALEFIDSIKKLSHGCSIINVGQCEYVPLRTDADPDRIMEELDEKYCDETGCDFYIYEGVIDEERKWLEDKLSELMNEFHQKIGLNPSWFKVVAMEEVDLNDYKAKWRTNNVEV